MSKVWISGVLQDSSVGQKQGMREKFYGHDWEKPTHITPVQPPEVNEAMHKHGRGELLAREEFPEAAYVFDRESFAKVKDLFYVCGFMAVKGKLAKILSEMDLGNGGLVPFPIYTEDKQTLIDGEFFFLNFGGPKDSFLPEESNREKLSLKSSVKEHGVEMWKAKASADDGDIAVSSVALEGADIWFEPKLRKEIFMSERLVLALSDADVKIDFSLNQYRIVETNAKGAAA